MNNDYFLPDKMANTTTRAGNYLPGVELLSLDNPQFNDNRASIAVVEEFQRAAITRESLRSPRGSVVSFHNINYSVKISESPACKCKTENKQILCKINGIMKPGLNAILGPSGGGKSSLLDVLAGRKDPAGLSGDVLIDGAPQPANFKCISGYVVQDDVVMGNLTVRENLLFSAALRLPTSISFKDKEERVANVISELGLTRVADSRVGTELIRGVSGGERKRTSIGMELITEPPVLFLDEPTTGLDASTSSAVLILLKRLSRRGRTMIFSIHQPRYSIFKLFDSLTLLAAGKMMYHGPANAALAYFSSIGYQCEAYTNPPDFFLDVINGDSTAVAASRAGPSRDDQDDVQSREEGNLETVNPRDPVVADKTVVDTLSVRYVGSTQYQSVQDALRNIEDRRGTNRNGRRMESITYATSFFTQLYWVTKRTFKNLIRNPQASVAQILVCIILGLVAGAIFFGAKLDPTGMQNRVGSLFFVINEVCFYSVSTIELFIKEKKLFIHQYTSGYYRLSAYFFSIILGDLIPMATVPAITFSLITYWMIGYQRLPGNFFFFMFTLIMVSYTSTAMALAVGTGMESVGMASLLLTIYFIFMMAFSGLLVNLPSVPAWINWLKYFSIHRYGLMALQVKELRGLYFCGDSLNQSTSYQSAMANCSSHTEPYGAVCYGEAYLCGQGIGYDNWAMWENIVALGCMTVIFLSIAGIKLHTIKKFT
ncbi:broad substrate specificity ATP-binding cassette transporter ABCG2 [Amia ocellicauda]|uniref:broad substrate specificity ATP-binding cassette transporter ABCG2 n=1 Tax=Amia ocellicauda TaxID=2972642 RepID=UPI003464722A